MARRRRIEQPSLTAWFDGLRADYDAAKSNRFTRVRSGVATGGSGADHHYRSESQYLKLMEYARDLDRNDLAVGQIISRAVDQTIGDGFPLDVNTGDEKVDVDLKASWKDWSEDPEQCDVQGEKTFWDMEQLTLRQTLVDGDILALPLLEGSLEMTEAHRLRTATNTTRNVVHGILLDQRRRRLEYWFTRDEIDPMRPVARVSDMRRIPAYGEDGFRQVFHVYNPRRISQTRGVTALAPIFNATTIIDDTIFAKLIQSQVCSAFAIFRKRGPEWQNATAGEGGQYGPRSTETRTDGTTQQIEGIGPGMEIKGEPDEDLEGFSPNVPNPEFLPFAKFILQMVGVNIGMPLVLVLLDAKETNFSGWRGAMSTARDGFRRNQKWLRTKLHSPVYRWKVRQWMAKDAALRNAAKQTGINIFGHRFQGAAWPYIEPTKDAAADLLRVRNALSSHRRVASERNVDWDDLSQEIVEDNAKLIEKAWLQAEQLKKDYPGLDVTWRDCASLPTPDGVKVTLTTDSPRDGGD